MLRTLEPSRAGRRVALAACLLALAGALAFVLFSPAARRDPRASDGRAKGPPAASAPPRRAARHEAAKPRPGEAAAARQGGDPFELVAKAWASGESSGYGLPQNGAWQGASLTDGLGTAPAATAAREPAASLFASAEDEGSAAAPDPVSDLIERGLAYIDQAVDGYTIYPIGRSRLQLSAAYDGSSCLYLSFHALFKAPL